MLKQKSHPRLLGYAPRDDLKTTRGTRSKGFGSVRASQDSGTQTKRNGKKRPKKKSWLEECLEIREEGRQLAKLDEKEVKTRFSKKKPKAKEQEHTPQPAREESERFLEGLVEDLAANAKTESFFVATGEAEQEETDPVAQEGKLIFIPKEEPKLGFLVFQQYLELLSVVYKGLRKAFLDNSTDNSVKTSVQNILGEGVEISTVTPGHYARLVTIPPSLDYMNKTDWAEITTLGLSVEWKLPSKKQRYTIFGPGRKLIYSPQLEGAEPSTDIGETFSLTAGWGPPLGLFLVTNPTTGSGNSLEAGSAYSVTLCKPQANHKRKLQSFHFQGPVEQGQRHNTYFYFSKQ
ncbi:hypothetical protein RRG08_048240 [Elysia crispata]|uniref:Uncharacterized protein n=1 Tax=Elysia crispata TaxID=231223 RepID=A0AAE1DB14_9GAST|nr:hypothetical protein RRG08_048240 [Elysia crispata]